MTGRLLGLRRLWPFLALETATALGGIANGIATVAFPWLVLEHTGNPSAAAAVGTLHGLDEPVGTEALRPVTRV